MAKFDEVFADLQAKMAATIAVITQYPDIAAEVKSAIDAAKSSAEIAEQQAQDDARANALQGVMTEVREVLNQSVVHPAPVEPVVDPPAPVEEGSGGDTGPVEGKA